MAEEVTKDLTIVLKFSDKAEFTIKEKHQIQGKEVKLMSLDLPEERSKQTWVTGFRCRINSGDQTFRKLWIEFTGQYREVETKRQH